MHQESSTSDEKVVIEISKAEALVLFEFLWRFSDEDKLEIHDSAEQRVLWDICCDLEKVLVEPFAANYRELLEAARAAIRDSED